MSKRSISINYDFRPDEPVGGQESEIRQAFAQLGWSVVQYGGGSSNVHRCGLVIESETSELDHPTLINTLAKLGIPLSSDQFTGTSIYGDVLMHRQTVEWRNSHGVAIQDVHLEVLEVAHLAKAEWLDAGEEGLIPTVGVKYRISTHKTQALQFPVDLSIQLIHANGKELGKSHGPTWRAGEFTARPTATDKTATVDLLVRILDIHRAGEALFRTVPVALLSRDDDQP